MKKIFLALSIFFLTILSFQNSFVHEGHAHDSSESAKTSTFQQVQYELPYPGLLPDNPLYFLKALRDNVLNLFIMDPIKKAEYSLLMANKRLASSTMLMDQGKKDLAITTLSKSGNYFYQAIQKVAEAKRQGDNAEEITNELLTASQKHQQVISDMLQESEGQTKVSLENLLQRAEDFQHSVEELKAK